MKKYFIWEEDYIDFDGDIKNDLDVMMELVVSDIKMNNWDICVKSIKDNSDINVIINKIKERVYKELKEMGVNENYFGEKEYSVNFESNNIMSSEFCIGMVYEGSEGFKIVENLINEEDYWESEDYNGLNIEEVDMNNVYSIMEKISEKFEVEKKIVIGF